MDIAGARALGDGGPVAGDGAVVGVIGTGGDSPILMRSALGEQAFCLDCLPTVISFP